jgi:hypothetical protein
MDGFGFSAETLRKAAACEVTFTSAVPTSGTGGIGALVSADSGKCIDTDGGTVYSPGPRSRAGSARWPQPSDLSDFQR